MKIENFISYEQPTNYIVHSDQYTKDGQIPVLTAGQSFVLGYTDEEDGIYTGEPVVIFDDFTTSVQYVDFPFKVKSSAMKILKNKQNANIKFCYYLLSWLQKMPPNHKRQWISTTSQIDVNLPPIEWQKKIVQKIESVSNIIKYRKEELKKLDELVSARFVELFGDPVINPKGFPCYTVGEVIDFQGGSQPDKKFFEYEASPDNIRLIQIRDYKSDKYITYIPKTMAKRFCTADDIMIGRYGPPIFQILKGIEGAFNVALMKATPKMGNREFIRQFLKQDCLLEYLEGLSKRTAGQDGIQMDKLRAYPFPYPPMELQEQFAAFVRQVDKSKVAVKKALDETQLLFDSLMQKYFG